MPLDSGTTATLTGVSFADPKAGHVVGAGGTIRSTTDGGNTWRPQHACAATNPCRSSSGDRITADLAAVGFWDQARGVAVGNNGTVVSTADGGKTWTSRLVCERTSPCRPDSPDRVRPDLTDVSVVAPSHVYAVGLEGTMLASDENGRSWRRLATCAVDIPIDRSNTIACASSPETKVPAAFSAVVATSPMVAHAVGAAGAVFETESGPKAFHPVAICVPGPPGSAACLNSNDRRITPDLAGVAFSSPARFGHRPRTYTAGEAGTIWYRDAGPWITEFVCATSEQCGESSPDRVRADLHALTFPHHLLGYAVGAGGTIVSLKRTPNSPPSALQGDPASFTRWRPEHSGTTNDLHALSVPSPDVGYAVGEKGTIVKFDAAAPGVQVKGVRPPRAPHVGGIQVTITGRGFSRATDVLFGRNSATGFTVDSDSRITATVPAGLPGSIPVSVLMPGGPSAATAASRFSYQRPAGGTWTPTPPCPSLCLGPAVALRDGRILAAGGGGVGGTRDAAMYDPGTRRWAAAAPLALPRVDHTMTLMGDGGVLAAGGRGLAASPDEGFRGLDLRRRSELFDPIAGIWSPVGEMVDPRAEHAATLLADGRVLVAGGLSSEGVSASAEVFDPATLTWTATGSMHLGRFGHTMTLLDDGKVLVVGGCNTSCAQLQPSAEIYDPAEGRWRKLTPPKTAHSQHTATLMRNGEVLVVGGSAESQNVVPFAERYNPANDSWAPAAPMRLPRMQHAAALLADGRLLVSGGVTADPRHDSPTGNDAVASAEIYDPATDRWNLVADMSVPRSTHTALLLQTRCGEDCQKVLVIGGERCRYCTKDLLEPSALYQPPTAHAGPASPRAAGGTGAGPVVLAVTGLAAVLAAALIVLLAKKARPA